jgi:hypothetical protein
VIERAKNNKRDPSSEAISQQQLYLERHQKAIDVLLSVPDKQRSALWHALYITSLGALNGDSQLTAKAFGIAQTKYADDPSIYVAMMKTLLAENYGSWDRVDAVARQAVAAKSPDNADEGALQYSKVYVELKSNHHFELTDNNALDWPLMKRGLTEMTNRFPSSSYNRIAALWACSANDAPMYSYFRQRIPDKPISDFSLRSAMWPLKQPLDLCDRRLNFSARESKL